MARRLQPFTTTIFATMSELAVGHGLGQSRSGVSRHRRARGAARGGRRRHPRRVATSTRPSQGIAELRRAVAAHQRDWYGLDLDPDTEVLVTVGATEAIAATFLALCEPGDEVVHVRADLRLLRRRASMAGAVPRLVRLHPPDWRFDPDELAAAVGPRTKMLLLNSPHNPTGKVFTPDELGRSPPCAGPTTSWR